jgi:hypothetical protein
MEPMDPGAGAVVGGSKAAPTATTAAVGIKPGNGEGTSSHGSTISKGHDLGRNLAELSLPGPAGTNTADAAVVWRVGVSTGRDIDGCEGAGSATGRGGGGDGRTADAGLKLVGEEFSEDDRASPTSVTALATVANARASAGRVLTTRDPTIDRGAAAAGAVASADAAVAAAVVGEMDPEDLKAQLKAANLHKQKMAANLKKKRSQLEEAESIRKDLETKVSELEAALAKQQSENEHLRSGLQKVVAGREDVKNKLRIKNDLLRELRADKEEAERRLRRSEHQRALEQDLLGNYRKLAQHTGYFKWGKAIRGLESALEQHSHSEGNSGTGGGGGASAGAGSGSGSNGGK